ncbi:MAG: hypothetical protein NZ455_04600 [Bacteroidia bacterium]|nr:hypothetical protein [Bacteroidia bacterium]
MPLGSAKHRSDSVVRSSPTRALARDTPKKIKNLLANFEKTPFTDLPYFAAAYKKVNFMLTI